MSDFPSNKYFAMAMKFWIKKQITYVIPRELAKEVALTLRYLNKHGTTQGEYEEAIKFINEYLEEKKFPVRKESPLNAL